MPINRRIPLGLLLATAVLGVLAISGAVVRSAREASAGANTPRHTEARIGAQQQALRARLAAAANTKPLLTALANHVDGPTLADLLRSQEWWREVRSEFQIARVIVGGQVLASQGSPDPDAWDRDVVAQARRQGTASAVVAIRGRRYVLVACRLPVLPDQVPVLVLAKILAGDEAGSRGGVDFTFLTLAGATGLGGAGLLVFGRRPRTRAANKRPSDRPGSPTRPGVTAIAGGSNRGGRASSAFPSKSPPALKLVPARTLREDTAIPTTLDEAPTPYDGIPGQPVGRYQILNRLGEGGMSEVFTAMAHGVAGFSRVFVLKRLRQELCHNKDAIAQFIDEARLQASLVHSNIVPVFDFGKVGSEYFMTQEYIVGRDVARLIESFYEHRQQTLSPRLAYYLAHETLQALQYAHTRRDRDGQPLGIVHRDIATGNILLSAQGEVKLADFGIVTSNQRLVAPEAGPVTGNAHFMSPEQARGQQVDSRSDLFSVAVVLYYCLTNRLVHEADNDIGLLFKAACGPPPEFTECIEQLPSPARDAVRRALAFDPAERFQTAAEFAGVLAPHIGGAKAEAAELMQTLFGPELQREAGESGP